MRRGAEEKGRGGVTWAKGDDRYDDNPKIKRAWRLSGYAVGLHWQAITASARHESDGLVDPEWLADKLAHLPRAAGARAVDVLVRLGLFDPLPAGEVLTLDDGCGFEVTIGPLDEDAHVVHDFLDYNDSSANLADRRRRDAERKAARRRGDSRRIPPGVRADSNGSPPPAPPESRHPGPTRPDPTLSAPPTPASGGAGTPGLAVVSDPPSSMPPFDPPPLVRTGRPSRDRRQHDRAVADWKQQWAAWLALPPSDPDRAAADRVAAIMAAGVSPSVLAGIGTIHAHRGGNGLLLLGAAGAIQHPDHTATRFGQMIGRALPPRTRWRLVECGCPATREEAA